VHSREHGCRSITRMEADFRYYPSAEIQEDAEPHLIEQVILNLVTNVSEAMRGVTGDKVIELSTVNSNDLIVITVTDTGPGIPISQQSKIFDPFYTTKINSSGIGLSICHRIILDHGGTLKLNSTQNRGAQFTIELPQNNQKKPYQKKPYHQKKPYQKKPYQKKPYQKKP